MPDCGSHGIRLVMRLPLRLRLPLDLNHVVGRPGLHPRLDSFDLRLVRVTVTHVDLRHRVGWA